jgi:MoaA/NifB/PqqE/SkfB family radical SAM enzyme
MEKILNIDLWLKCNYHCRYCTVREDHHSIDFMTKGLDQLEYFHKNKQNIDKIIISGGEPTIHPKFEYLVEKLINKFPYTNIAVMTNGGYFYNSQFAKRILSNKQIEIIMSAHGYDKTSFAKNTGYYNAYHLSEKALENIISFKKKTCHTEVRFILNRANYLHLDKMFLFIKPYLNKINRVPLMYLLYSRSAYKNKLGISLSKVVSEIEKHSPNQLKLSKASLYHIPHCVIKNTYWPLLKNTIEPFRSKLFQPCKQCTMRSQCVLLQPIYPRLYGLTELSSL